MLQLNVCPGSVEKWWSIAAEVMQIARSRHQASLMCPWVYQLLSQVSVCSCYLTSPGWILFPCHV